jgi:hypothetical protein
MTTAEMVIAHACDDRDGDAEDAQWSVASGATRDPSLKMRFSVIAKRPKLPIVRLFAESHISVCAVTLIWMWR